MWLLMCDVDVGVLLGLGLVVVVVDVWVCMNVVVVVVFLDGNFDVSSVLIILDSMLLDLVVVV